ncbi:MAG: galactose-1-phosphate uridylyltransferase [Candidatus Nanoarchaeia archaeon]
MGELRKDYILDRWALIATERAKRPNDFKSSKKISGSKANCPFCPGHEHMTPPATYTVRKDGKWLVRCFANKFAAVGCGKEENYGNGFLTSFSACGNHEVLVETPNHNKTLADLPLEQIKLVLDSYVKRILAFDSKYVLVFKNEGAEAGTSLVHTHTQIIAYNQVPKLVEAEVKAFKKYDSCPFCSIVRMERNGPRMVFENDTFIAFTPFASRFPLEVWIFPKKHIKSLVDLDDFSDLAFILKKILLKLKRLNASYNFVIHNAPRKSDFHFHIEVLPRLSKFGGFELGTDTIINVVSPEEAAKFYRK